MAIGWLFEFVFASFWFGLFGCLLICGSCSGFGMGVGVLVICFALDYCSYLVVVDVFLFDGWMVVCIVVVGLLVVGFWLCAFVETWWFDIGLCSCCFGVGV